MMDTVDIVVNGVFAGVGVLIITTCGVIFWRETNNRQRQQTKKMQLSELAQYWLDKKEVCLSELAPIWCEPKEEAETDQHVIREFSTPRIQAFYASHVLTLKGDHRDVAEELLAILDREGDCPSVVNVPTDVETSWNSTTFELLGKTSLADHSLNVADELIRMLEEDNSRFLVPDGIVVALAHDIGKTPSVRGHLYALGEHPLSATKVLIDIEAFNRLARKDILLKAIKLHHKKPDDMLGKTLKRADQVAREKELEYAQSQLPPLEQPKTGQEQPSLQTESDPGTKKEPFKGASIPWFDVDSMIAQLRPQINQTQGRRFTAFSMSNGYVYVQPKLIENIAKEQAEKAGVLDVVSMGNSDMQKILLSIAHSLRQGEMLAKEMVKPSFYGSYFTITFRGGNTLKGYYTPFHAEAFGSIAELEQIKTGILLEFASVELFAENKG
jgi:hypothetical protein